jgi:HlyD family secretion protein
MQILASVDESDIGMISKDQHVRFTVQAYPNVSFQGTVQQVRLQSATVENVVNYTVVVAVENPDGKLLPGMTATVEFVTGSVSNALLVPNAALRFRPSEAMFAEVRGASGASANAPPGQRRSREDRSTSQAGPGNGSQRGTGRRSPNAAMLWYLDDTGELAMARARTGITDGQRTQVESDALHEGMQIIVGVTQAAQAESSNPFQAPMQAGPQRPPGSF